MMMMTGKSGGGGVFVVVKQYIHAVRHADLEKQHGISSY